MENCPRTTALVSAFERSFASVIHASGAQWMAHLLLEFDMPRAGTIVVKQCYDRLYWRPNIKEPLVRRESCSKGRDEVFVTVTTHTQEEKGYVEPTTFLGGYETVRVELKDFYNELTLGDLCASDLMIWPTDLLVFLMRTEGFKAVSTSACIDGDDSWFKVRLWDGANDVCIKVHGGNLRRSSLAAFERDPNDDK